MKLEKYFDHTDLNPDATSEDIKRVCEEAKQHGFASVCINEYYTELAKKELEGTDVAVCVAVGFPSGATSSEVKAFETRTALSHGADEIDMVINIGALKEKNYDYVRNDIKAVKEVCGDHILKVIIEACLLTDEEKIKACELAVEAGAQYVKTSTGFSKTGATIRDVTIMKKAVQGKALVKAAGGIRDYFMAVAMIDAGADRLGTSATMKIVNQAHGISI